MKTCTTCGIPQDEDQFGADKARKDGRKGICKTCCNASTRKWQENNKERIRETANRSYHRRKESISVRRKVLRKENPEKTERDRERVRANSRKHAASKAGKERAWKNLGITLTVEQYDKMLIDQGGCCKICGVHADNLKRKLDVDHCHKTGTVRGLLCTLCNSGIGKLKDSVELLTKAIAYLSDES